MKEIAARPAQRSDLPEIAVLLASNFGGSPEKYIGLFAYWAEANPAWNESIPRGWLVRSPQGEAIAFTANIPFDYMLQNREASCFVTGSTCVHKDWRGHQISKLVGQAFLTSVEADLLLATGSTPPAHRLWMGLGMQGLARSWNGVAAYVVGDGARFADDISTRLLSFRVPGIGGTAARLLRAASLFDQQASRSISVIQIDAFRPEHNDDIERMRSDQSATTYARRDTRVLNWIYFGGPHARQNRVVFAAMDGTDLIGYLGVRREANSFYLLECRCRDSNEEIARALILAAQRYAQQEKMHYIMIWRYCEMLKAAIPSTSIFLRHHEMKTYCYKSNAGVIDEIKWESTPGDGDLSVD